MLKSLANTRLFTKIHFAPVTEIKNVKKKETIDDAIILQYVLLGLQFGIENMIMYLVKFEPKEIFKKGSY